MYLTSQEAQFWSECVHLHTYLAKALASLCICAYYQNRIS